MALRGGFLIPNAKTYAPDFQTAQPDQGDFLILGNSKYGVVTGCEVTLTGFTAEIGAGPHIVVVNDDIYLIGANRQVSIAGKGEDPRFDLVVFDKDNGFSVVTGVPAVNPVFPDVSSTFTVLAAIFIPASGGSTNPHIIDKRNFIQTTLTAFNASNIIRNYGSDGTSIKFNVNGAGKVTWGSGSAAVDTSLQRMSAGVLKIEDELNVAALTVTDRGTIRNKKIVTAETIDWGTINARPAVADLGDIYVDNVNADIAIWKTDTDGVNKWMSIQPNLPAGTIIMSMVGPDRMPGYLPLLGQTLAVADAGNLPVVHPEWLNQAGTQITLPDGRGFLAMGAGAIDAGNPGFVGVNRGTRLDDKGTISLLIEKQNLPPHVHDNSIPVTPTAMQGVDITGVGGAHDHSGSVTSTAGLHSHVIGNHGAHGHSVNDNGHSHGYDGGWAMVASTDANDTCLDTTFADASHGHRTKPVERSGTQTTNISVVENGMHGHPIQSAGEHFHSFTITAVGTGHTHTLPAQKVVGNGQALTFKVPTLSMYFYIKI